MIGIALKLMDIPGSNFSAVSSRAEFTEANHIRIATCIKRRKKMLTLVRSAEKDNYYIL